MQKLLDFLIAAALLVLLAWALSGQTDDCPDGKCPPPAPSPSPAPAPPKKPRWEDAPCAPVGALVAGAKHADGTEISCDYPGDRHRKNSESKGLGLCVFTSIHHAADWQDVEALLEMPKWMITRGIPGGGYPGKVAELIVRLCKERGAAVPDYLQIESNDLEVLKAACAGGRMPCVTYAFSLTGRYGGRRISHMVNLVHLDERWAVILDNNHPGYDRFEWMNHADFLRTYSGGRTGWAVVFLDPPPPMPPYNAEAPSPHNPLSHEGETESQTQEAEASATDALRPPLPAVAEGGEGRKTCPCSAQCTCGCNDGKPCVCAGVPAETFGVEQDRLVEGPRYRRNGREVSRREALQAVSRVPDDRHRRRLTVIGPSDDRKRVLDDWSSHPALRVFREDFLVKGYAPDHWHVARYGFATGGRPTIYVQDRGGAVLLRRDRYDGPDELATTLRRLRPDYEPKNDPQSRLLPWRGKVPWSVWAVGGAAVAAYLLLRRK